MAEHARFPWPSYWRFARAGFGSAAVLCLLVSAATGAQAAADGPPLTIKKIYFTFHPVCWRMHGPEAPKGYDQGNWTACYNWELRVNQAQKEFMSRMKPDDALVLFPISRTPPMLELEEHAVKTLGRRCVIPRCPVPFQPPAWSDLSSPIERFLDDVNLEGREKFLENVPLDIQKELEAEIRKAWGTRNSDWSPGVLKVVYYSRLAAREIQDEFKKRNLRYDAATVQSEAFGEGFEQCAMTWKQMLVPYLGLAHAADNIFELSVSGAPFLVSARLRERVRMDGRICLYLWEGEGGRNIALVARSYCRLRDPQLFAQVSLGGMTAEVRDASNRCYWPKADVPQLTLAVEDGRLKLPVYNGIRRDAPTEACYLIATGISMDEFRKRLADAPIEPMGHARP